MAVVPQGKPYYEVAQPKSSWELKFEINLMILEKYMAYHIDYLIAKAKGEDIEVLKFHIDAEGIRMKMVGDAFGDAAAEVFADQKNFPKMSVKNIFCDVTEPVDFETFKKIKLNETKILNS